MELISRFWRLHRQFLVLGLIPILLAFALACLLFSLFDVVLNTTPSIPYGFYRAVDGVPSVGDLVYVNPEGIDRLWIARERGYVVGGTLIKYVVGKEGDEVSISEAGISINGILIRNSTVFSHDPAGREIPNAARSGKISKGALWVMSDYNELSFDSRYFGEISTVSVRSRAKHVLTW